MRIGVLGTGNGVPRGVGAGRCRGATRQVLVDVANPLDFSSGMPPSLAVCNTDSLGEQIQRRFPETRVVKTLNTVNHQVMVDPSLVPGEHDVAGASPGVRHAARERPRRALAPTRLSRRRAAR